MNFWSSVYVCIYVSFVSQNRILHSSGVAVMTLSESVIFWMTLLQRNASWSQCNESKPSSKFSFSYAQHVTELLFQQSMDLINFRSRMCLPKTFWVKIGSEPCP